MTEKGRKCCEPVLDKSVDQTWKPFYCLWEKLMWITGNGTPKLQLAEAITSCYRDNKSERKQPQNA